MEADNASHSKSGTERPSALFYGLLAAGLLIFSILLCVAAFGVLGVLVAGPLVAIVNILPDELYRTRFLPTVTDTDLYRLSRKTLHEKVSVDK